MRDLIYFDSNKAASLVSQSEGGLLTTEEASRTDGGTKVRRAGADLKVLEVGGTNESVHQLSLVETRTLHHGLMSRLEDLLDIDNTVTVDRNEESEVAADFQAFRDKVTAGHFIRASGSARFYDFARMLDVMKDLNPLAAFVARCELENSAEYLELHSQRASAQERVNRTSGAAKNEPKQQLRRIDDQIKELSRLASGVRIEDWLRDGITQFVDLFMPHRLEVRLAPFDRVPFQVIANLKRDCFVDTNFEQFLYSYGSRPDVDLGVLGFVTSTPAPDSDSTPVSSETKSFLDSFLKVFDALEEFNTLVKPCAYPDVTVFPIAVYQSSKSAKAAD